MRPDLDLASLELDASAASNGHAAVEDRGPLLSLPPELRTHIAGFLTFKERWVLSATCSTLWGAVDGSFLGLRLSLPDHRLASEHQILHGLKRDSPPFIAALLYMLKKGAVLVELTHLRLWSLGTDAEEGWPQKETLRRLPAAALASLRRLAIELDGRPEEGHLSLKEKLAMAESCPELVELRLRFRNTHPLDLAPNDFDFLARCRHLSSLDLSLSWVGYVTGILAKVPLARLRQLRLDLLSWGNGEGNLARLQKLITAWPCLPYLQLLGVGNGEFFELRLPWERLPGLCILEGVFAFESQATPTLARLRRLVWTWTVKTKVPNALPLFLTATTSLEELAFTLHEAPSRDLKYALARRGGTLRSLELCLDFGPPWAPRHPGPELLALVQSLPGLHVLKLRNKEFIDQPWQADPRFLWRLAAAAGPALRLLCIHRVTVKRFRKTPDFEMRQAEMERELQIGVLVDEILGHPDRDPGLDLRVVLRDEEAALAFKAVLAARDAAAACRVTFDWQY